MFASPARMISPNSNQLKMKSSILMFCIAFGMTGDHFSGQSTETTDQVIEGGKIIVELVKALSAKKEIDKDPGCKGKYADLCIENAIRQFYDRIAWSTESLL